MAKYYAVRKGRQPGIYATWPECQANTSGFSGAEYKSFTDLKSAEDYMNGAAKTVTAPETGSEITPLYPYAFTDGSYNPDTKISGWGGFLCPGPDMNKITLQGSTSDPEWTSMRNVAGEIIGCMEAVKQAVSHGLSILHVYHDYTGVSCWPDGAWSANNPNTREYRDFIQDARAGGLEVIFHKVPAHTGVPGNEEADILAKASVGI